MDSVARIVSSMQAAAADCRLPVPSASSVKSIIGLSLGVAMPRLFGPRSDEEVEALIARYREHYLFLDDTPTTLFDGVASVLQELSARGYLLAVATGKARAGLERVLKETELQNCFHATRTPDESCSKPDPLMLSQILEELAVPVTQALMVGDSTHDMEMAQRLGMDRAGIVWGAHDAMALQQFSPRILLDDLHQLLVYLR